MEMMTLDVSKGGRAIMAIASGKYGKRALKGDHMRRNEPGVQPKCLQNAVVKLAWFL